MTAVVWRVISCTPKQMVKRADSTAERCDIWLTALMDALMILGQRRRQDESPMAFMTRMIQEQGLPAQLQDAGALCTVISYSRYPLEDDSVNAVRRAYGALERRLTRPQLLKLMLYRAVHLPLKISLPIAGNK